MYLEHTQKKKTTTKNSNNLYYQSEVDFATLRTRAAYKAFLSAAARMSER